MTFRNRVAIERKKQLCRMERIVAGIMVPALILGGGFCLVSSSDECAISNASSDTVYESSQQLSDMEDA